MDNTIERFVMDEGTDRTGTNTTVHFDGEKIVKVQSFDATEALAQCDAERKATAGQKWGEMRKVGYIPPNVYAQLLRIHDGEERRKATREWLLANPSFISFDRYAL